jgi:hypothetical protein
LSWKEKQVRHKGLFGHNDSRAQDFVHVQSKFMLTLLGRVFPLSSLRVRQERYYEQLAEAKFVLCPSGMGYDT